MTHNEINQAIIDRELFSGDEEGTYYHLYNFVVDNYDDPCVLFKVAIKGYYQKLYKWTDAQTDDFIEKHKADSIKWTDGVQEYYYDWGKGRNKITEDPMHFPNLDHIDPHSLSKNNNPDNFRIRCKRLNENKGNTNSDNERRATIIDLFNDMDQLAQQDLINYLQKIQK
jgi:hypothetical protein